MIDDRREPSAAPAGDRRPSELGSRVAEAAGGLHWLRHPGMEAPSKLATWAISFVSHMQIWSVLAEMFTCIVAIPVTITLGIGSPCVK